MILNSKSFIFLFLFVCILVFPLFSQSKLEIGFGIGINHSTINDKIYTDTGSISGVNKGNRLLVLNSRVGYKFTTQFHLNSGVGLSFIGSLRKDLAGRETASTIEIPLQIEWNPVEYLNISSGPVYNYVYSMSSETDQTKTDLLNLLHTRHQFGLSHRIAVSHKLIELYLSYAHYFSDTFNSNITDVNGNEIGTLVSKMRNIQIGFVVRR